MRTSLRTGLVRMMATGWAFPALAGLVLGSCTVKSDGLAVMLDPESGNAAQTIPSGEGSDHALDAGEPPLSETVTPDARRTSDDPRADAAAAAPNSRMPDANGTAPDLAANGPLGAPSVDGSSNTVATTGGTSGATSSSTGLGQSTGSSGGTMATGGTAGPQSSGGRGGHSAPMGSTSCVLGPFQAPELLTGFGLDDFSQWSPSLSNDGTTLYFGSDTFFVPERIYRATRTANSTSFSKAVALNDVNSGGFNADGAPCIGADELSLLFYSTRSGIFDGRDLWSVSRASKDDHFAGAKPMKALNGSADDGFPWLSEDGLTLLFNSRRNGLSDLFIATRNDRSEDFANPAAVGGVNGPNTREERAALSSDGLTLYFTSDRAGGLGDLDTWMGTRPDLRSDFGNFTNLTAVNSGATDLDVTLSRDSRELFFSSNRSGAFRLYRSVRRCP